MATLLKNYSEVGLYILQDFGGWVAANTPGEADLEYGLGSTAAALGDEFIYFSSVIMLKHQVTCNYDGDTWYGFKTWPTTGKEVVSSVEAGHRKGVIMASVEVDATTQANFELFFNRHITRSDPDKYLVRQWDSETFRQWPIGSANKNYIEVIIRGYDIQEVEDKGKDVQLLNIAMEEVTSRLH